MRFFSSDSVAAKYDRLGFHAEGLLLKLDIGNFSISAAEHPWRGIVLFFQRSSPRTIGAFDAALPAKCSLEQIAGLIYVNIACNSHEDGAACKAYFQTIGIPLFQ
jgi:hypothetical protein